MLAVISPSTSSVAVAPASVYVEPCDTSIGVFPRSVITGAVVSPGGAATTFTVRVTSVAAFPSASDTL